ncbi:MAG: peptide-methionine (R)-S-oxide reductase [Pseudorhodobacter sp.]|nr:peptide-methionine (R)-S-oxide reductase [Pseudorhodobacter sp.]
MKHSLERRAFMQGAAAGALAAPMLAAAARAHAGTALDPDPGYSFEVTRSDDAWRALLGDDDHAILRLAKTEKPRSSALWYEQREGSYHCKGCGLHVYDAKWKTIIDLGWVFFRQSVPDTVLMGIDFTKPYGDEMPLVLIEVHCRRCGSHFGHIITLLEDQTLHCLNGASLTFNETPA